MNIEPAYIAPIVAAMASVFTLISSIINRNKISQLTVEIDGRMKDLIKLTEESNLAKGRIEGRDAERNKPMIPMFDPHSTAHEIHSKPLPAEVVVVNTPEVAVVNTPEQPVPITPVKP